MQKLLLPAFLTLALAGCAPEPAPEGPYSTEPADPSKAMTTPEPTQEGAGPTELPELPDTVISPEPDSLQQERERAPLDLSPPQNLNFDDKNEPEYTPSGEQGFDAKALFQKEEEESRVSGAVTPIITESDDPDEPVVLDGGQISIEVKTE